MVLLLLKPHKQNHELIDDVDVHTVNIVKKIGVIIQWILSFFSMWGNWSGR